VIVDRTSRFGNPFAARDNSPKERALVTELFANLLARRDDGPRVEHPIVYPSNEEIRERLAGHDLACWCPLPEPGEPDHCHAAVLLRLAAGESL
jgi:hypothetical protein